MTLEDQPHAPTLADLGWDAGWAEAWARVAGDEAEPMEPARVAWEDRGVLGLLAATGEHAAGVAGRMRHHHEELPAVGDWVAARLTPGKRGTIRAVLPRRTAFVRKIPGDRAVSQVVAANVDTLVLVAGLDADFNPRRLERTLALAWESGATPVILLNKVDVCAETPARLATALSVAPGVAVHPISARTGQGLDALTPLLVHGRTLALVGSSGAGKSTLVNRLLGRDVQATREVRASDSRGRHTTIRRELIRLPSGAWLLDTPGLRELQLWDAGSGLDDTFEDVFALAAACRFSDCGHGAEPGCAVVAAARDGRLDAARLASYLKLHAELRALHVRQDQLSWRGDRRQEKIMNRALKKMQKDRGR